MKKILISFSVLAMFAACGKSDSCSQDDFVGTWKGTEKCAVFGNSEVTITIAKNGSDLSVSGGTLGTTIKATIDDCSFEGGVTVLGIGEKIKGSIADSTLTMTYTLTPESCTYTLKR